MNSSPKQHWNSGFLAAASGIIANVWLGASSLYWRELGEIPPTTLVVYRVLLSLPTLLLAIWAMGGLHVLKKRPSWHVLLLHAAAAILVIINWGTFIWASIHGHVLESGLGYLLAPCIVIFVGVLILHEKVSRIGTISMALILIAMALLVINSGELNKIVYLTIAITWGGYACIKKMTPLNALHGLVYETTFLAAPCLLALFFSNHLIRLPSSFDFFDIGILGLAGFISVFPLFLFGYAANKLPLSVMGLFQFVLPTTQFIVAMLVYQQKVSTNSLVAFSIIWAALALHIIYPLASHPKMVEKREKQ